MHGVTLRADESTAVSQSESTDVYVPFDTWAGGLADPSPGADEDGDGFSNLYEFAVGGNGSDPGAVSVEGSEPGVTFEITSGDGVNFRFLRRTFVPASELEMVLEESSDLAPDTWVSIVVSPDTAPLDPPRYGFEEVEGAFSQSGLRRFYRLRITQP